MDFIRDIVSILLEPKTEKLSIPVEDIASVRGYYERINRGAVYVDSEVVSSAQECALVFPPAGVRVDGPCCPLY